MREHRALGFAGRAAGEHDLGQRVPVDGAAGSGSARRARSGSVSSQMIGRPSWRADASVWRVAMTTFGAGLVDDLASEFDGVADVERDGDGSRVGDGEEGDAPFGPIDGPDDRAVARLGGRRRRGR